MSSYLELVAQKEEIEQRIAELRKTEKTNALVHIRATIAEFGLTPNEVFGNVVRAASTHRTGSVAPKYRDPISGKTWTGRGITPLWLRGKAKEDYLITKVSA